MSGELARYDAMLYAIAECHRVDEVREIHERARALEVYAKQARNLDAERKAADVRLRAERRAGELLKELARVPPDEKAHRANASMGHVPAADAGTSPYRDALVSAQLPERTAQRWQQLADVPKDVFEQALRDPVRKPTTTALIEKARDPQPHAQMPKESLGIWGTLRDFERLGYLQADPDRIYQSMTETMQADMRRLIPLVVEFLQSFDEVACEPA